jgi:hypothetical protein
MKLFHARSKVVLLIMGSLLTDTKSTSTLSSGLGPESSDLIEAGN